MAAVFVSASTRFFLPVRMDPQTHFYHPERKKSSGADMAGQTGEIHIKNQKPHRVRVSESEKGLSGANHKENLT
jgi:hypothetical protein